MKHSRSAGGVVLNKKGLILIVSQHGNSWSLPKGHIDSGEDALAAARREIQEESGIQNLKWIRNLGSYERYRIALNGGDDLSELKTIEMFLFETDEETLRPVDPDNPEARWVWPAEAANLLTHLKDREFLLKIIPDLKPSI